MNPLAITSLNKVKFFYIRRKNMKLKDFMKMVLGVATLTGLCIGVACADGTFKSLIIVSAMVVLALTNYSILAKMGAFNELH